MKEFRENTCVKSGELDPSDWAEIKSLISQIIPLQIKKNDEKSRKVKEKLISRKGLVHWGGFGKNRERNYYLESGEAMKNGKVFFIVIPGNHSALVNFSFDQEGFYVVEGVDNLPIITIPRQGGQNRKLVSLNDEITITPYSDQETAEIVFKKDPNQVNNQNEDITERENLSSGGEVKSVKGGASQKDFDLEKIKKYFLENDIKEITLKNGKLEVIYNGKKTSLSELTTNNPELWQLVKYCQEHNWESLSRKDLEIIDNVNNSTKNTNDNSKMNNLWIGGSIVIGVAVLGIFVFRSQVKKSKK